MTDHQGSPTESKPQGHPTQNLVADWDALQRVFIQPENEAVKATLVKYMEQILFGLQDFLKEHVGITEAVSLQDLSRRFMDSTIDTHPRHKLADVIQGIIEDIAPYAVNVASPYFVGHMTSALPFFMVHLQTIAAALNQNLVKLETSKVVSIYERQVLAKLHRRIFQRSALFYRTHIQRPESSLGSFVGDGTLANLTALWVARNNHFKPQASFQGIETEGIHAAMAAYGVERAVILVSRMGHYSLRKAGGVLGLGNQNVIPIDTDSAGRMDIRQLTRLIRRYSKKDSRTAIVAVVGVAGTTETGHIDPLEDAAHICKEGNVHFHVDAAWGGPTLMSQKYGRLLRGIEHADSVTIDGHKQFYMPMGCGMVYFRDPQSMDAIAYHAAYVNRPGSVDLGIKSLEGSRAANALILGSALDIMGSGGFAVLIDHGIDTARKFAREIQRRDYFELITPPALNILTYRICPPELREKLASPDLGSRREACRQINQLNILIQRQQREAGQSFVSRTTLPAPPEEDEGRVVLRAVIMNPMTDLTILRDILDEQAALYETARLDECSRH